MRYIFSCPLFAEDTIKAVVIQNLMKFLPTVIDFKDLLPNQNVQFPGTRGKFSEKTKKNWRRKLSQIEQAEKAYQSR